MAGRKRYTGDDEGRGEGFKYRKVTYTSRRITRGMIVDAPRKAVFNTSELLESILLHLPARTLFAIQRVSRQFREAIRASPGLQSRTLAKPKAQHDPEVLSVGLVPDYSLVRILPRGAVKTGWGNVNALVGAASVLPLQERVNRTAGRRILCGSPLKLESRTNLDILRPASWKDLYLADVVCKEAYIEFDWQVVSAERTIGRVYGRLRTEDVDGWTVGKLVDAVLDQKRGDFYYYVNRKAHWEENVVLRGLMERLENTGGRKIRVNQLRISIKDVIILSDQEREQIVDPEGTAS